MSKLWPVRFKYDFDKVLAALLYYASRPDLVTNFDKKKAISLIFLAEKAHLERYGEPIFGDTYEAWPWGAVPTKTLTRLDRLVNGKPARLEDSERLEKAFRVVLKKRIHRYPILEPMEQPDMSVLSEIEVEVLDEIVLLYGKMTFEQLARPIHPPAWDLAFEHQKRVDPGAERPPSIRYEDLFDSSGSMAARERMLEDHRFRRALSDA